MRTEKLLCVDT